MKNIKNVTLKKDLPTLLGNIKSVSKNEFNLANRFAIDITEKEPASSSSYVYATEAERDADLAIVEGLVK